MKIGLAFSFPVKFSAKSYLICQKSGLQPISFRLKLALVSITADKTQFENRFVQCTPLKRAINRFFECMCVFNCPDFFLSYLLGDEFSAIGWGFYLNLRRLNCNQFLSRIVNCLAQSENVSVCGGGGWFFLTYRVVRFIRSILHVRISSTIHKCHTQ